MEAKKKNVSPFAFAPTTGSKLHSCPGDYYGCIGPPLKAFSPALKPVVKENKLPPNMSSPPGKKGGPGYTDICFSPFPVQPRENRYDDPKVLANDPKRRGQRLAPFLSGRYPRYFEKNPYYTLNVQPIYKKKFPERFVRFGPFRPSPPNKKPGGCMAGGFDKWPKHSEDPWIPPHKIGKPKDPATEPILLAGPFWPQPRNKTLQTRSVMGRKVDIGLNATNWNTFRPVTFTQDFS